MNHSMHEILKIEIEMLKLESKRIKKMNYVNPESDASIHDNAILKINKEIVALTKEATKRKAKLRREMR